MIAIDSIIFDFTIFAMALQRSPSHRHEVNGFGHVIHFRGHSIMWYDQFRLVDSNHITKAIYHALRNGYMG